MFFTVTSYLVVFAIGAVFGDIRASAITADVASIKADVAAFLAKFNSAKAEVASVADAVKKI